MFQRCKWQAGTCLPLSVAQVTARELPSQDWEAFQRWQIRKRIGRALNGEHGGGDVAWVRLGVVNRLLPLQVSLGEGEAFKSVGIKMD